MKDEKAILLETIHKTKASCLEFFSSKSNCSGGSRSVSSFFSNPFPSGTSRMVRAVGLRTLLTAIGICFSLYSVTNYHESHFQDVHPTPFVYPCEYACESALQISSSQQNGYFHRCRLNSNSNHNLTLCNSTNSCCLTFLISAGYKNLKNPLI